ncbi:NADH dehydrogenase subunit 1 (mitochondrion) [Macrosteles quadrilineatus]|uniref:NADH-ubiquinone oxidoreductase chain 1 n=2 Tax=Macrosteles TaxID=30137 RepID=A0A343CXB3_MACQU|nr:NADH dehydrogenase subunit 1 [Macrosteles quadrilineatus]ARQ26995.1 NADH dehydrogenase subunit 1 [Macrosteles quadrilineatus]
MYFISFIFLLIFVLVSVGFFTLFERKVLGYIQCRKGPNKVGYMGLLQPFSDGIKLFIKEQNFPMNSNYFIYIVCPFMMMIQSLFMWVLFPYYVNCIDFDMSLLFFLCCGSLSIYGLMICGWSSNSIYSMLGCIRSVSQAVSYEVSLSLILLCFFMLVDSYSFMDFYYYSNILWFFFLSFPLFLCWFSCCMAESNRTPFDFSEGESELVSGFNIEYGGGGFALLFISEYSSIIFICLITVIMFFGSDFNSIFFYIKLVLLCFLFIWVRGTLPRFRYDKLMYLAWKCYLPLSLNYLFFFMLIKVMCFYHFFL